MDPGGRWAAAYVVHEAGEHVTQLAVRGRIRGEGCEALEHAALLQSTRGLEGGADLRTIHSSVSAVQLLSRVHCAPTAVAMRAMRAECEPWVQTFWHAPAA
jgi:hypothetical protein